MQSLPALNKGMLVLKENFILTIFNVLTIVHTQLCINIILFIIFKEGSKMHFNSKQNILGIEWGLTFHSSINIVLLNKKLSKLIKVIPIIKNISKSTNCVISQKLNITFVLCTK